MDTTIYTYQPLMGNGSPSIRLLTLLPGSSLTALSCEINEVQFGRNGNGVNEPDSELFLNSYEALSHTWGPPILSCTLSCHGAAIKITQKLHHCLAHLRYEKKSRKLWIDAICIDQSNYSERARQIKLMRNIYEKAKQVVIWLGVSEDDDSTQSALDLILRAAACLRQETGQRVPQFQEIVAERFDVVANARRGFPPADQVAAWEPLVELFKREWFRRVWVFQESAIATTAIIKIGDFEIDWADLCTAVKFFFMKNYHSQVKNLNILANSCVSTICANSGIGSRVQPYQRVPIIFLLEATLAFFATKPKDRVFAILGLTLEEDEFKDDYELTTKSCLTKVARVLLHNIVPKEHPTRDLISALRLLSHAKHYPHDIDEDFPSWVPKWHRNNLSVKLSWTERDNQPMFAITGLKSSAKFNAGGKDYPGPLDLHDTPDCISLEGYIFSEVTENVNILRIPPKSRPCLWDLVLDIWKVRPDCNGLYPTNESIDEAFALTLTMAGTVPYLGEAEVDTYHAIDFQHFCVSIYEQALTATENPSIDALKERWQLDYERLRRLVGDHIKSPIFSTDLQISCLGRKLFCTRDGYIGIGDVTLEKGDLVCVFFGGNIPFILRKSQGKYRFVGECYVHGIMHGESLESGRKRKEWFELF